MSQKTVFVQLPVISSDFVYNLEHIPLGIGSVASALVDAHPELNCIKLDQSVESLGGDSLILNKILEQNPSRVCFSLYLWNIERSLFLAQKLKELSSEIEIIVGGPEVNPDNDYLLSFRNVIDGAIVGEGEEALKEYINKDKILDFFYVGRKSVSLLELPSPYEKGLISPSLGGGILLEGIRGCPSRCIYCYYHKRFSSIQVKPLHLLIKEIKWALNRRIKYISFVDPSFLKRPSIEEFLISFIRYLPSDISLYCELNAEDVTPELASLLARCGVSHVEVGLQSINKDTLRLIKRRFNRTKFVQGIKELKSQGIKVMVDIMVGLPGDRKKDIVNAIDFVTEETLFDEIGVYPLSLLSGTELKNSAASLGLRYQKTPPYLILETPTLSMEEMKECMVYAEKRTSVDLYPIEFPPIFDHIGEKGDLIYEILLLPRRTETAKDLTFVSQRLFSSILLRIERRELLFNKEAIARMIECILKENPYLLINFLIEEEVIEKSHPNLLNEFCSYLSKAFSNRTHCDRDPYSTTNIQRSLQFFGRIKANSPSSWCMINLSEEWIEGRSNPSIWLKVWGEDTSFFVDRVAHLLKLSSFNFNILEGGQQPALIGPYVPARQSLEI